MIFFMCYPISSDFSGAMRSCPGDTGVCSYVGKAVSYVCAELGFFFSAVRKQVAFKILS